MIDGMPERTGGGSLLMPGGCLVGARAFARRMVRDGVWVRFFIRSSGQTERVMVLSHCHALSRTV